MKIKRILTIFALILVISISLIIFYFIKGTINTVNNVSDYLNSETKSSTIFADCVRGKSVDCISTNIFQNAPTNSLKDNIYYEYDNDKNLANKFSGNNSPDLSFEASLSIISRSFVNRDVDLIKIIRAIEKNEYGNIDDNKYIQDKKDGVEFKESSIEMALNDTVLPDYKFANFHLYSINNNVSEIKSVINMGIPVIVSLDGTYVVVTDISSNQIIFHDPSRRYTSPEDLTWFNKKLTQNDKAFVLYLTDSNELINKVFSEEGVNTQIQASCIALHESRFNYKTQSPPNENNSIDYGIMQINDQYWPDYVFNDGFMVDWSKILDPEYNIDVAYHIYYYNRHKTFDAWSTKKFCSSS